MFSDCQHCKQQAAQDGEDRVCGEDIEKLFSSASGGYSTAGTSVYATEKAISSRVKVEKGMRRREKYFHSESNDEMENFL
jgi:hypothetical protein